MDIDSILDKLGRTGKFQMLVYIFCGLQSITFPVWDMLSVTSFMAPSPEYSCRILALDDDDSSIRYFHNSTTKSKNGTCEEGELVFDLDTYGRTMVTEWQLVGDKAMLVEISQSLFMAGMMFGSIFLGQMADTFGRKPILIVSAALSPLLGLASGFASNIWIFTALRVLIGFICPGTILTAYVLALELFPSKRRAAAGILLASFNGVAYVGLALLAFFIKDWRYLQITTSAFRCALLPLCFFMPESVQWLASMGKYDKLERLLQRIATVNKIDIPFPILDQIDPSRKPILFDEPATSESDLPVYEKDKSIEDLFMYDSAVSLDRDYIPAEDNYSNDNYSSESETEDTTGAADHHVYSVPSSTSHTCLGFPGHYERVSSNGLGHVNSSISILSDLKEQSEMFDSQEDLEQAEEALVVTPRVAGDNKPVHPPVNKPLRKKSISLCHIPNFVSFVSEIQSAPSRKVEASAKNINQLIRTVSIPNVTINPVIDAPDIHTTLAKDRHNSNVSKKPPNLILPPSEQVGSSFLLSIPTLAMPFGFSQNFFPNIGAQYENMESSQSDESIQDDTSGFNSSTYNIGQMSEYDALEEGYSSKHLQTKGYSDIQTTSEDNLPNSKRAKAKGYNILDLFRMKSIRMVTISSMIIWFATYTIYAGLSMSTDALAGDPYINFSLVGLVEIPAVIVAAFAAMRVGRKFPSGVCHFLTALSCCLYLVLPIDNDMPLVSGISVVAILLAKCFTSAAYNIESLLTAEVLPTPLSSSILPKSKYFPLMRQMLFLSQREPQLL